MTYTVVRLDGKEQNGLSLDQVKELFFRRQINQDSLIYSTENPSLRMLKREFDLGVWIPEAALNSARPPSGSQSVSGIQPPATPISFSSEPVSSAPADPNNYTQNNQSQTFYQASTLPEQAKLPNIQSNYAPTEVSYEPLARTESTGERPGLRSAAVFLIIGVIVYVGMLILGGLVPHADSAEAVGQMVGRAIVPIAIDLLLAAKLWNRDSSDGVRRWVLVRAYVGFFIGLLAPFASNDGFTIAIGVVTGLAGFFYLLALALVLHGKHNPSTGRIYSGVASFVVFVFAIGGILGIAALGKALPTLSKLQITSPEVAKYKIEGTEFKDKTTGASVSIPEGWVMLSTSNPMINTPYARMVATDTQGNRIAMLEVVPVPAQLDMKRQTPGTILDQLCDSVVASMEKDLEQSSLFGRTMVKEMSRLSIYVGKHPAKLLIVEKMVGRESVKGHIIITYDELTFYVLHSWCPIDDYQRSQNDFQFFEKSFTVPDDINSTFTQTAENENRK